MTTTLDESYPAQYESLLRLKNGKEVFLRPVLHTDGDLLIDLFNRMSPQAIYRRFLSRLTTLPEDLLHRFTRVNHQSSFALLAVVEENGKDAVIGVARYAYDADDEITDLGVAVRDDWQNLGLGKALLVKVIEIGKEHGIFRFGSMMDPQNNIMRQILQDLDLEVRYTPRSGFYQLEIIV